MLRPMLLPVSLCLALLPGWVVAGDPNPHDGVWAVSFDGKKVVDLEGTLVVDGDVGTWKMVARAKKNPCVGRESPIAVQTATEDEFVFKIERSKSLRGCKDTAYTFKGIDESALQGEQPDGRSVTLTRE